MTDRPLDPLNELRRAEGPAYLGRGRWYDPRGIEPAAFGVIATEPELFARSVFLAFAADRRPAILERLRTRVYPAFAADRDGHLTDVMTDVGGEPAPLPVWEYQLECWAVWAGLRVRIDAPADELWRWARSIMVLTLTGWRQGTRFEFGFSLPVLDDETPEKEPAAVTLSSTPRLHSERGRGPLRRLEWLVERRVLGWTTHKIAQRHGARARTVHDALRIEAKRIGMDPLKAGRRPR